MALIFLFSIVALLNILLSINVPLYGNTTLGYYYTNWYFGSQRAEQSLIVDTGSYKTLIDCNNCTDCGTHIHKPFNMTSSTTLTSPNSLNDFSCTDCGFYSSYSEGSSYSGKYVQDIVRIGDKDVNLVFGCISSETGLFITQSADGITGLAPQFNILEYDPPTPDKALFNQNIIDSDIVSMCLGSNGGQLGFGTPNNSTHIPNSRELNIKVDNEKWLFRYNVYISSIVIEGMDVGLEFEGMLDSGTTYTYFEGKLYDSIANYFNQFCQKSSDNCGGYSELTSCFMKGWLTTESEFFASFPVLEFYFGDNNLYEWKPASYLINTDAGYCIGLAKGNTMLGASFMKDHDFVFDNTRMELTIKKANCNLHSSPYKHRLHMINPYNKHLNQVVSMNKRTRWVPYSSHKEQKIYTVVFLVFAIMLLIIWYLNNKKTREYVLMDDEEVENCKN